MGWSGGVWIANYEFKLNISDFKEALRQRWPDIQINDGHEGNVDFDRPRTTDEYFFSGSTIQQQQVGWWGGYEEFAEFCIWFRRYIPEQYQLLAHAKSAEEFVVVSYMTTAEQFVSGLSADRFAFEISSPANTRQTFHPLAEKFKQVWPESIADMMPDDMGNDFWFLRAQQGRIEYNNGLISFDDTDLSFAAHFAIWCCSLLASDQNLSIRGSYYPKPQIEVKTQLTSSTTEDELFGFLMKSFPKA